MFYCTDCRDKNDWPGIIASSEGQCEICGCWGMCFDTPSKLLPPAKERKTEEFPTLHPTLAKPFLVRHGFNNTVSYHVGQIVYAAGRGVRHTVGYIKELVGGCREGGPGFSLVPMWINVRIVNENGEFLFRLREVHDYETEVDKAERRAKRMREQHDTLTQLARTAGLPKK